MSDVLLDELVEALPAGAVATEPDILETYRFDWSRDQAAGTPLAVVRPRDAGQVQVAVRWAARHRVELSKIHQAQRKPDQVIEAAFRDDGHTWPSDHALTPKGSEMNVELKTLPETRVAYMRHLGPYGDPGIGRLWQRFDAAYEVSEWQNAWYVNGLYGDGLTNEGHVLGHWGGDWRQPGEMADGVREQEHPRRRDRHRARVTPHRAAPLRGSVLDERPAPA